MRVEHNACKSLVTYADNNMLFVVHRLLFLFTFLYIDVILSQYYMTNVDFDNKISALSVIHNSRSDNLVRCALICGDGFYSFSFNSQTGMCRLYSLCFPCDMPINETGWSSYAYTSIQLLGMCTNLHEFNLILIL